MIECNLPGLDTQLDNNACRVVWWALYSVDGLVEVLSPHLMYQIYIFEIKKYIIEFYLEGSHPSVNGHHLSKSL